ncbi:MAG: FecR domain-containing protein [Pedobacter sp.]|uniref:FecR family protein n=1 Tax=Pedobacter sp. TaxID=1411316 RepID=UPI0035640CD6
MDNKEITSLLKKFREGTINKEEKAFLENWVLFGEFTERELSDDELDTELNKIESRLNLNKTVKLWPRIAAAVAILLIVGSGIIFYIDKTDKESIAYTDVVSPGSVGATLTLANGKKIKLDDAANGELAKESGIIISKTASGQIIYEIQEQVSDINSVNTLSTAKGENYSIILPDKSKVWLNAASSLTYSTALNVNKKRVVELMGEAYFEVFHDKAHPFIVETKNQTLEVLGTHFNLAAYPDDPVIRTTLLEGRVSLNNQTNKVFLTPGQQATLSQVKPTFNVKDVNVTDAVAWKNGLFAFKNESIRSIMEEISRWYDVDFELHGDIENKTFGGTVSRFSDIREVLNVLELTGAIHFKIEGRRIIVTK